MQYPFSLFFFRDEFNIKHSNRIKSNDVRYILVFLLNIVHSSTISDGTWLDMVLSGQCRQDSKFLETVTVGTVRLETVRQ